MSIDNILQNTMAKAIAQFVPVQKWFGRPDEGTVWVSAFRVFRVPTSDGRLAEKPIILEFDDDIRAVFIDATIPYPNFLMRLLPDEKGSVKDGSKVTGWETTRDGVVLLLITPFSNRDNLDSNADAAAEGRAYERVEFTRAVLILVLGRNAAFEPLFKTTVDVATGDISQRRIFQNPMSFPQPPIEIAALRPVLKVVEGIRYLDANLQRRVRLALRWYLRALNEQSLLTPGTGDVDGLLNYWVALEVLTRSDEQKAAGSILRCLADIHELSTQQAGQIFPISGVYKMRKRIMHQGELSGIHGGLMDFLSAVFFDILVNVLDIPYEPRTQKYLDGSAKQLVQ